MNFKKLSLIIQILILHYNLLMKIYFKTMKNTFKLIMLQVNTIKSLVFITHINYI